MSKHSRERAYERYNIELSKKAEKDIMQIIKNNEHTILYPSEQDPKHKKFCYITYKNKPLKVLYKRTNKGGVSQIITVYPFDVEEYNNAKEQEQIEKINGAIKLLKDNGYIVYKRKCNKL